jgi:hypothetical protein
MDASPDYDQPIPYVPADAPSRGAWVLEGPEDTVVLDLNTGTMTSARRVSNVGTTAEWRERAHRLASDAWDLAAEDEPEQATHWADTLRRAAHLVGTSTIYRRAYANILMTQADAIERELGAR